MADGRVGRSAITARSPQGDTHSEAGSERAPRNRPTRRYVGSPRWASFRRVVFSASCATLGLYLVLAFALFLGAWRSPATRYIGTPGDPPVNMWYLAWTPYSLLHGHAPFFTDHINYPFGVNLMWNALMSIPGVILAPVTLAFGPISSYNTLVTLNLALSSWCAYLAFRQFVSHRTAAFAGGLVYGFSPYMLAQSHDHPSLTAAFIPPLLLFVLHDMLVTQRQPPLRTGIALGVLTAVQLLITEELLASEALAVALGVLILCLLNPRAVRAHARHALVGSGIALVVFASLAAGPLRIQFGGPQRIHGVLQPPNVFVSDLANFVVPTSVHLIAPASAVSMSQRWSGNLSEFDAYLGVPLVLVLVFVTLRYWSRPIVRLCSLLMMTLATLSLGPNLHLDGRDTKIALPWRWVARVPVMNNMLPNRLMLYVDLLGAILLAIFVDHLVGVRPRWKAIPGALLGMLVAVSLFPALPFPSTFSPVPTFFSGDGVRRVPEGSVVLIAPYQQTYPDEPMLWQADARMRFRMPEGYFIGPDANGKPVYGAPSSNMSAAMFQIQSGELPPLTTDLRQKVLQDLAARRVQTVVVGPMEHQQDMLLFFGYLFRRPPAFVGDVYVWWDVARGSGG